MPLQRLDKLISSTGKYSRSEAAALIRRGGVLVNGLPVHSGAEKADPDRDVIEAAGERICWKQFRYFMFNKPTDVLTATEDKYEKTVIDMLPPELRRIGLFPAGRLDKASEGLLILTNDGNYAHRIISPNHKVYKSYYVETEGLLTDADCDAVEQGIELSDFTCQPGKLVILQAGDCSKAMVYIREGKYHQVRRMLGKLGKPVTRLCRMAIGGLSLKPDLEPGSFYELSVSEAELVFQPSDAE